MKCYYAAGWSREALPAKLSGREVLLVIDGPTRSSQPDQQLFNRLAAILRGEKARVKFLRVPEGGDGESLTLADAIDIFGAGTLSRWMPPEEPPPPDEPADGEHVDPETVNFRVIRVTKTMVPERPSYVMEIQQLEGGETISVRLKAEQILNFAAFRLRVFERSEFLPYYRTKNPPWETYISNMMRDRIVRVEAAVEVSAAEQIRAEIQGIVEWATDEQSVLATEKGVYSNEEYYCIRGSYLLRHIKSRVKLNMTESEIWSIVRDDLGMRSLRMWVTRRDGARQQVRVWRIPKTQCQTWLSREPGTEDSDTSPEESTVH